jgi:septal ring factor EnvC (AmiA/AmiB activator)
VPSALLLAVSLAAQSPTPAEDARRLAALTARVTEREAVLRERVTTLYRLCRGGLSRAVVSGNRESASARLSLLSRVLRRDLFEIAELSRERDAVGARVERWQRRSRPEPEPTASALEASRGQLSHPLAGSRPVATLGGLSYRVRSSRDVRAVAPGRVVFAAPLEGFDLMVVIDHGGGDTSLYARLGRVTVSEGDEVRAGERIGRLERKGTLYFELRRGAALLPAAAWFRR